jgi:hypothetical protein
MIKDKALRLALEALQNCANGEDDVLLTRDALAALKAALEQELAMQVRPSEFIRIVKGKETATGIPVYWAEWPSKEQP